MSPETSAESGLAEQPPRIVTARKPDAMKIAAVIRLKTRFTKSSLSTINGKVRKAYDLVRCSYMRGPWNSQ